jgi:hypothetical protein
LKPLLVAYRHDANVLHMGAVHYLPLKYDDIFIQNEVTNFVFIIKKNMNTRLKTNNFINHLYRVFQKELYNFESV